MREELLMKHNMHKKPGLHVVSGYTVRPLTEEADSAACLAWKDVGR